MKVKNISVRKLFGIFDHDIPLRTEARITIIHGPNGIGKTIILRMLEGLLSRDYAVFYSVPFASFCLSFDDDSKISVQQTVQESESTKKGTRRRSPRTSMHPNERPQLTATYTSSSGEIQPIRLYHSVTDSFTRSELRAIDQLIPGPLRLVDDRWVDISTNETLLLEDVIRRHMDRLRTVSETDVEFGAKLKIAITEVARRSADEPLRLIEKSVRVRLLRAQRLDTAPDRDIAPYYIGKDVGSERVPTVEQYAKELAGTIGRRLREYNSVTQRLDRSFPHRLLAFDEPPPSTEDILQSLQKIEADRTRLISLGILDHDIGVGPLEASRLEKRRDVLTIYCRDAEEKLAVFARENTADKIALLKQTINRRFRYKRLAINSLDGLVFRAINGTLSPSELSSGEQHELILLYELLFKVGGLNLFLIDEPEISLHVGWQESFLDDLLAIVELSQVDVVLATHSPIIIGEHWNLSETLKGPPEAEFVKGLD